MTLTFADTFYYLALINPRDQSHRKAVEIGRSLSGRLLTTQWVLTEVADALANPLERPKFLALIDALQSSQEVIVVPASEELFWRGVELYRQRADKDWPLTDCISFLVMQDHGVSDALTGDVHFKQAGFRPLLLEP